MPNFSEKFRVEELQVEHVGGWRLSLRPSQPTLGALVLSLGRPCGSLADLTDQESVDWRNALVRVELIFKKILQPERINYLALMMVDHQVHFHVLPRYSHAVKFDGVEYPDKDWPGPHSLEPLVAVDDAVLAKLLTEMRGVASSFYRRGIG